MADDVKINEFGEIVFDKPREKQQPDLLWDEYCRLEYEVLNNQHHPTNDPVKIARYNELKKHFDIKKSEQALKQAKERIKKEIISANLQNSPVIYTAISNNKKTNE